MCSVLPCGWMYCLCVVVVVVGVTVFCGMVVVGVTVVEMLREMRLILCGVDGVRTVARV